MGMVLLSMKKVILDQLSTDAQLFLSGLPPLLSAYVQLSVSTFRCSLTSSRLRRFLAYLVLLGRPLPPVRQVAAMTAVELRWNVVVTSWTRTPIVHFGVHCLAPLLQICLRQLPAIIIALSDHLTRIKLSRNSEKCWQKVHATTDASFMEVQKSSLWGEWLLYDFWHCFPPDGELQKTNSNQDAR